MIQAKKLHFNSNYLLVSLVIVFLIWFIYWCEIQFDFNFNKFGIYPRDLIGLRGVIFSPFIHSNTSHLFNNSIPFIVLFNLLFVFYKDTSYKVLIFGSLFTGLLTWIIARESYHIGLSGVIYLLFSFIFFSGVIKKHFRLIAASLVVIFLYGSMIWYVLPIKDHISWEGHLSGFIVGFLFAFLFKNKGIKKETRTFPETEFDSYFDEEGNFIGDTPINSFDE